MDVASDGVHIVRHGPWASSTNDEAFSSFANGKLIREYKIKELIDIKFLLPHSVSHFTWAESENIDDSVMRYLVNTKDGNSFVFDLRTGAIIEASRRARLLLWGAPVVLVLGLTTLLVWRNKMKGSQQRSGIR